MDRDNSMPIILTHFLPYHFWVNVTHYWYGKFWVSFDLQLPKREKGEELVTERAEKNLH